MRFNITNTSKETNGSSNIAGERKYVINSSELIVKFGDIVESKSEVVVSSDDNWLSMSGGVSWAILAKGGTMIQNDAKKHAPAQLGDVIVTTAGNLRQKYVFHCITIGDDGVKDASSDDGLQKFIIRRALDKCLKMMPLLGVKSIAFPAIGAGVANFSLEEIAICMADVITEFLYSSSKQFYIEIYLYNGFNKNDIMDYMSFFENITKSILNYEKKAEKVNEETINELEKQLVPPLGDMAAISPFDEHIVFVSYSRKDIDTARLFCKLMDQLGISYWFDVNGKYSGNNFKEVLVDAIETSKIMVFFSSVNSNQSSFVIKEISLAVAGNKKILPIKLDDSLYAKSVRFDLSDIDWIEFSKENQAEALEKFKYCIQLYLKS